VEQQYLFLLMYLTHILGIQFNQEESNRNHRGKVLEDHQQLDSTILQGILCILLHLSMSNSLAHKVLHKV
jgi:hypothetical protein